MERVIDIVRVVVRQREKEKNKEEKVDVPLLGSESSTATGTFCWTFPGTIESPTACDRSVPDIVFVQR